MKKILSIIILSIIVYFFLGYSKLPHGSDLRKFDSDTWKKASSPNHNSNLISEREKMLKDLINNILPDKNRDEIEQLLGASLETSYFKSIDKDLIYYLGPERNGFMNIDSEWLLIWLDESNKFKRYKIIDD